MLRARNSGALLLCLLMMSAAFFAAIASQAWAAEEAPDPRALGEAYVSQVRPLFERYCHDCHGAADTVEGDINLAALKDWNEVAKHPPLWQKVAEMLGNELMPPQDAEQPTEAEREQLKKWVTDYLRLAARAHAGDPGRVVPRRLNNAEYTYTIRDLTGVESLDPAKEFPADGAAGEGFTNTGNSLVMSPALVTKYLDAAKEIASHAVLLPDGFRFSPHTTNRDWTDDTLARIRNFYGQFTDAGGGSNVNLQGVVFDTNQGGRLPIEKYLAATIAERDALASGQKSIADVAGEQKLNAKYLGTLWAALNATEPSLLLDELRGRWRTVKADDAPALAQWIEAWQKALWKFNSVAQIGRVGGATRWMEAVDPPLSKESRSTLPQSPPLPSEDIAEQPQVKAAFAAFRELFPPALCYTKIVPVDEVISLTLFYREDDELARLMLDDLQKRELDRMWDELHFVSRDALTSVDALEQLLQFATQDADPKVFEPLKKPTAERAAAFQQRLVDCEPPQVAALVDFAARPYRRPLLQAEKDELNALYKKLRAEELSHEEAFRLTLARILVSPAFMYRLEKPVPGAEQGPVSDWELASRLSYFLWSSLPDAELRQCAAECRLHEPAVLTAQTRRMLGDAKTRRLATEFALHWLHIDDFEHLDEKSERHFPTFSVLRAAMAEESTLFFTDLFQHNGSVLDILDADYTFLNQPLAQHYGIPDVKGDEWRRVNGVKKFGRGGVLAQATTLAKQSGASRTSPILRGNWICEALLGDKLPKPPKGVPPLPDDEAALEGLTMRQVVMKHVSDPKCSSCHRRIDPFGYSLEAYDAIGRHRTTDLGDRPIDTHVKVLDGAEFDGLEGLRNYLLSQRREAFVRQFCRKLLGYALGRAVQLSDEPLLEEIKQELAAKDYKVDVAVDAIVNSRQFREIRGADAVVDE